METLPGVAVYEDTDYVRIRTMFVYGNSVACFPARALSVVADRYGSKSP